VAILVWTIPRIASDGGAFIELAVFFALFTTAMAVLCVIPAVALWQSVTGRFSEADYD
jgi:hypothetical protein